MTVKARLQETLAWVVAGHRAIGVCRNEPSFCKVALTSPRADKRGRNGQDLIEYALIGTILVLLMVATFPPFAAVANSAFASVSSLLA